MDPRSEDHHQRWRRLERLLDQIDQRGLKRVPGEDVVELARLYRSASSNLVALQEEPGSGEISPYLEALVGRAYAIIYAPSPLAWRAGWRYLHTGWPRLFAREHRFVFASTAALLFGFLLSFVLALDSPEAIDHLLPESIASFYGDRPTDLRAERFAGMDKNRAADFSSELLQHNVRVALNIFWMGLGLGIGTLSLLFLNGIVLGTLAANFWRWDLSLEFWTLILPHGVAELFGVVLAGAGGLILADALLRPGRSSRLQSLRERAPSALGLGAATLPLFCFAAIVEAWVTPLQAGGSTAKLCFAALSALGIGIYLRAPWLRDEAEPS